MKKTLIGTHNLENFIQEGKLCLGPEHILSPGARDTARNRGVTIAYGTPDRGCARDNGPAVKHPEPEPGKEKAADEVAREALSRRIITLLKTEFNLDDPEAVRDVTLKVLRRIGQH
ncbi:MAG: hypothetical protein V6Z89_24485 [Desulfobacter sp.]